MNIAFWRSFLGASVAIGAALALGACGGSNGQPLPLSTFTPAPSPSPTSTPHGTIVEYQIPTAASAPGPIVAGPDGNMWFLEGATGSNKIAKITPAGVVTEYPLPTSNAFPDGLVTGPDGNLWYIDEADHLGKVTTSGTVTIYPSGANDGAIAVGPDHNLWLAEFGGGNVNVFATASGGELHSYPSGVGTTQLESIAAGPDGNMWYDSFANPDNVVKMITGTGATTVYSYTPTIQNGLRQIISGPDGNLWMSASDSDDIARITTGGVLTTYPIPSAGAEPYGITSDGTNLWFTEPGTNLTPVNKIGKITTAGVITEYGIFTPNSSPVGIAVLAADGTVWFTQPGTNEIGRLYP